MEHNDASSLSVIDFLPNAKDERLRLARLLPRKRRDSCGRWLATGSALHSSQHKNYGYELNKMHDSQCNYDLRLHSADVFVFIIHACICDAQNGPALNE